MIVEPATKHAVAFFDGQNLFHAARSAFGYSFPNYDPQALAQAICFRQGWVLKETRFYTGLHSLAAKPAWNYFWKAKLAVMAREGIYVFSRPLRYRNHVVRLPDGTTHSYLAGEEKGVDVRIAVDVIGMAFRREYDVALIFSQDQDLSEAAREIRVIAREQDRWIKIACAFPVSPTYPNTRGVNSTDWIPIDRDTYQACLDHRDYRPKAGGNP